MLSGQKATVSDQLSLSLLSRILMFVGINSANHLAFFNFLIRKIAHFSEYLILSILTTNTLAVSFQWKNKLYYLISFILCTLYAASDEIHQLFIPGRSGQINDVILDSFGVLAGIMIYHGIKMIIRYYKLSKDQRKID